VRMLWALYATLCVVPVRGLVVRIVKSGSRLFCLFMRYVQTYGVSGWRMWILKILPTPNPLTVELDKENE
jgi:hypothetical protein